MKRLLLLFFLCAITASAQGVRFGDSDQVILGQIPGGPLYSVPNAVINFCGSPNVNVPCANKVTTYTDATLGTACPTSTQVVLAGTNTCVGTTDGYGNWGVWVAAGTYTWTVTIPGGSTLGPYTATLSSGGSGTTVSINGTPVSSPNFNNTTPAAGAGFINCSFNFSGSFVAPGCPFGNSAGTFLEGNGNALTATSANTATSATTATTAGSLSGTPTLCSGSTPVAKGILANGNASCGAEVPTLAAVSRTIMNGYTLGFPGSFSTTIAGQCPGGSSNSTSYPYVASDFSCIVTRSASSSMTDSLPQAGSTGFGSGFYLSIVNNGSASDAISTTGSAFTCPFYSSLCTGGSGGTLTLPAGSLATIYSPDNSNWTAIINEPGTPPAPAFPITVTGGVSGGIPYFSNTTTESASALLATNALVVGGGAGNPPATGNGDFTYATHTLTGGASSIFDLSAAAGFKPPSSAAFTANASHPFGIDTGLNAHIFIGFDSILPSVITSPTSGHVAQWNISGGSFQLVDGGTIVNSLTCDNVIFTTTGCNAVTGAVTLPLKNALADSVLGNNTTSAAAPAYINNPSVRSITLNGSTSGSCALNLPATGGTLQLCSASATVDGSANLTAKTFNTTTNCASSASPAVCGSAAAGSVVIAAGATTVTVNTSAVDANSQIFVFPDESLGTVLSVTCNSTLATAASGLAITARVANTSFTISTLATIAANPVCLSYHVIN